MNSKQVKIVSDQSIDMVLSNLNKFNGQPSFFSGLFGKIKYAGHISKDKISLVTFDSPPIEIRGNVVIEKSKTVINLEFKWESMRSQIKALVYALGYPIVAIVIFLNIYYNPTGIFSYIFSVLFLLGPIVLVKYILWFHYSTPNPLGYLNFILKVTNGKEVLS